MSCSKRRAWRFENVEQLTAVNTLREIVGFDGEVYMEFKEVVRNSTVLNTTITPTITITPSSGITLGTIDILDDATTVVIPLILDTTGSYMFVATVTDLYGEEITRRGVIIVESLTGT